MRQAMVVTMMITKVNQHGSSSSINQWTLEVAESEELESKNTVLPGTSMRLWYGPVLALIS